MIGPALIANPTMNTSSAPIAGYPRPGLCSTSILKMVPTVRRAKPMTTKPAYMIGLRPSLSTKAMAMNVASTFVIPTTTVPHICWLTFSKPASAKIFGA